jgi:SET domain-containing protein
MNSTPFTIKNSKHGQGLFSTKEIKKGDFILEEKPFAEAEMTPDSSMACWKITKVILESKELLEMTLELAATQAFCEDEMKDNFNKVFLNNLSQFYPRENVEAVFGRVITNNLNSNNMQSMYRLFSRINHSCKPNCTIFTDETGKKYLIAKRDIVNDEELTIPYIGVNSSCGEIDISDIVPVEVRQQELWRLYKFVCKCEECEK